MAITFLFPPSLLITDTRYLNPSTFSMSLSLKSSSLFLFNNDSKYFVLYMSLFIVKSLVLMNRLIYGIGFVLRLPPCATNDNNVISKI